MLSAGAWRTICHETLRHPRSTETGGILLGHADPGTPAVVRSAGDPGPRAIHEPQRFLRDLGHARALAARAWKDEGAEWIGEWHTHPTGDRAPSTVDVAAYRRHLTDPDLNFELLVSLIVFMSGELLAMSAWIVTTSAVTSAMIEVAS